MARILNTANAMYLVCEISKLHHTKPIVCRSRKKSSKGCDTFLKIKDFAHLHSFLRLKFGDSLSLPKCFSTCKKAISNEKLPLSAAGIFFSKIKFIFHSGSKKTSDLLFRGYYSESIHLSLFIHGTKSRFSFEIVI